MTRYRRVEGWTRPDGSVEGWALQVEPPAPFVDAPIWYPTVALFRLTQGAAYHDDTTTVDVRLDGYVVEEVAA